MHIAYYIVHNSFIQWPFQKLLACKAYPFKSWFKVFRRLIMWMQVKLTPAGVRFIFCFYLLCNFKWSLAVLKARCRQFFIAAQNPISWRRCSGRKLKQRISKREEFNPYEWERFWMEYQKLLRYPISQLQHTLTVKWLNHTPHSKMAANKLFFCLHVN